ncbi:MAG: hypothetical protein AAB225_12520 [Acidobacteriota bacterium]
MDSGNRRSLAIRGALFLLALALPARLAWQGRDVPFLGHFHDDGLYWVSAKSLAEGAGYRIASLPGEPHQTKYPPLYPALLAVIWKIQPGFPGNVTPALVVSWLALPAYLLLTSALLTAMGVGRTRAWVICLILAAHPRVGFLGANLMADLLFCALISAALWMAHRGEKPGVAGLLAGAAFLAKVAALPLLVTAPLCYLLRKRHRHAALFAAGMLPAVLGWTLWTMRRAPASTDPALLYYTNYLGYYRATVSWSDLPLVLAKNAAGLLANICDLVLPASSAILPTAVVWLLALAFIGAAIRWARRAHALQYLLFAAGYAGLFLFWNFPPNERFLLPLYPLLLAALVEAWVEVSDWSRGGHWSPSAIRRAAVVLAPLPLAGLPGLAIGGICLGHAQLPGLYEARRQVLADHRKAYEWIRRNTPASANFIAFEDPNLYAYTGRRARRQPASAMTFYRLTDRQSILEPLAALPDAAAGRYRYLLVSPTDYPDELLESERVWLRQRMEERFGSRAVFRSGEVRVYELGAK